MMLLLVASFFLRAAIKNEDQMPTHLFFNGKWLGVGDSSRSGLDAVLDENGFLGVGENQKEAVIGSS
jgi:hypothetical protein